ncbi:hypothetical protein JCM6882_004262 [Rhodosporidiobolus microsporus]
MGLFRKLTSRGSKAPDSSTASGASSGAAPPSPSSSSKLTKPSRGGAPSAAASSYAPPPEAPAPQLSKMQENALAALAKHDTCFLVDDSGSMEMFWDEELAPALASVVRVAVAYDDDGIEICFFNSRERKTSRSADEILSVFHHVRPKYTTPTADAMKRVLEPYMQSFEDWHSTGKANGVSRPKPLNLVVLTDGAPDKEQDPEGIIVEVAKRLDLLRAPPFQVGISFVQIGNYTEAAEHLRSLDDDLKEKHKIRDMVDTTLYSGKTDADYLLKALLGGINRSIDRSS